MTALLLIASLAAEAQSADKVYRIGVVFPTDGGSPLDDVLEQRWGDLGWMKGRNVSFSYPYSRVNDALPALAKNLVHEPGRHEGLGLVDATLIVIA